MGVKRKRHVKAKATLGDLEEIQSGRKAKVCPDYNLAVKEAAAEFLINVFLGHPVFRAPSSPPPSLLPIVLIDSIR